MADEKTCVMEKKGIGTICFDDNTVTFLIKDDMVKKIRDAIVKNVPYMDIQAKKLASKRLAELKDPEAIKKTIPVGDIKMIGIFQPDDKTQDPVMAFSLDKGITEKLKLPGTMMNFAIDHDTAMQVKKIIPKTITMTDKLEQFWKSLPK